MTVQRSGSVSVSGTARERRERERRAGTHAPVRRTLSAASFSHVHPEYSWWVDRPVRDIAYLHLPRKYQPQWRASDAFRLRNTWHLGYDHQKCYWPSAVQREEAHRLHDRYYLSGLRKYSLSGLPYLDTLHYYRPAPSHYYYDRMRNLHGSNYFHQRLGQQMRFCSGFYTPYKYFYYAYLSL